MVWCYYALGDCLFAHLLVLEERLHGGRELVPALEEVEFEDEEEAQQLATELLDEFSSG